METKVEDVPSKKEETKAMTFWPFLGWSFFGSSVVLAFVSVLLHHSLAGKSDVLDALVFALFSATIMSLALVFMHGLGKPADPIRNVIFANAQIACLTGSVMINTFQHQKFSLSPYALLLIAYIVMNWLTSFKLARLSPIAILALALQFPVLWFGAAGLGYVFLHYV